MSGLCLDLASLPPELIEKIFCLLSTDLASLRSLAQVSPVFQLIACSVRGNYSDTGDLMEAHGPVLFKHPVD